MTQYVILIPGAEATWAGASPEGHQATYAQHDEFTRLLAARGRKVAVVDHVGDPTAVLIYGDRSADRETATADEHERYYRAHVDFAEAVGQRSRMVGGEALHGVDAATTMRHRDGAWTLTDGPFAETTEWLCGFYVVDVPDLDALTALCELLPPIYALELRPVAAGGDAVAPAPGGAVA
jgi:hypothetical protein